MALKLLVTVLAVAIGRCWIPACLAHESPEHEVDELTEQMKVHGQSADLLIQRAIEFKVLGKYTEAAKDLERALDFEGESIPAQRELSQAYFALGKTNEALATVSRALKSPAEPAEQASLLMVRAGILRARRDHAKALRDANEAIRNYPMNVEWYLIRSQFQAALRLRSDRVHGLEDGIRETGSGLLLADWVDALIDDGQLTLAQTQVEKELAESRWRASWLIRRAKVHRASGREEEAKTDLAAALEELNRRLSASTSDALLFADRGLAYDLLGKREEARRDYLSARDKGLTDEWVRERIRALRDPAKDDE